MCLTEEWFMHSKEREARRNEKGVELKDAIEDLRLIDSTAYMIAWEMAHWIYRNWTLEQIQRLPEPEREVVMQYANNNVSQYIEDVSSLGAKSVRQERRLERKATEQTETEARKNQPILAEESDEGYDPANVAIKSPGCGRRSIASRLRMVLLFLGVSCWF